MVPFNRQISAGTTRWLRNANDSLLTEMVFNGDGEITGESLSGMMHPTAEGHSAMATNLASTAETALGISSSSDKSDSR